MLWSQEWNLLHTLARATNCKECSKTQMEMDFANEMLRQLKKKGTENKPGEQTLILEPTHFLMPARIEHFSM